MQEPKYPVKTVSKAIEIINFLSGNIDSRGAGITEISNHLKMGKSTVHRLLDTLLFNDYIEKNEDTNCYRLGWRLYTIGLAVPQQNQIPGLNTKYLMNVAKRTCEIANLGVLHRNETVILSHVDGSTDSLKVNIQPGSFEPAYATALGKVMLCEQSEEYVMEVLSNVMPLKAYTVNTIRTPEAFLEHLKQVRKDGYAIDREEYSMGLICTARPIRNYTGSIIAAMSVSMPTARHSEEAQKNVLDALLEATQAASRDLGYRE